MNGKKNVLITGGTGYIGFDLVHSLIQRQNCNIAVLVRDVDTVNEYLKERVICIDSNSKNLKSEILNFNPEVVIHLAAYSTSLDSIDEIHKLIESNITFTALLLNALEGSDLKLFVNTGSFSEYYYNNETISPTYFYSATKTSAKYIIEYFSKKNNFKMINAILYSVYGKKNKNKKVIDYAMASLDSNEQVKMSSGDQILDFIHIEDVISFYINLIDNYTNLNITKQDYFVGTGKGISIKDLVFLLEKEMNQKANISWGGNKSRKRDTIHASANIVKNLEDLLWSAKIDIRTGIKKYIDKEII
ncbi:NAD(P)-dependent oxidoreductase [Sulfurimonas sp. HSL3-2]|uniref:NAD-dependent epimerase/dehydratase family protein n=1 Tax=Hydrocurvibacter mobilis TaxID=3131936 RepID=UPI0031F9CF68